jgi:tetratricopeptide (TPR) repeat protein/tRNA A-37 threonylcarbamoyl transferase component Bud32
MMLTHDEPVDPASIAEWVSRRRTRPIDVAGLSGFEILAELGRGGMGVVYKARHRQLDRIVALKMIIDGKHAGSAIRERFLIEAQAVARLHHPNIVQLYDIGEADGHPFVTLEMLEGGSLADRLKGTTQSSRAAAELVETLALAMDAAHQAGIVHRDLKPPNILYDRDGTPKISDFGLAKRLEVEDGQTMTGQVMGTPSYMAPEQAEGAIHKIGPPADVYALGAVLYEMLTGRPPFKGASLMETLRQVVHDDAVTPSRLAPRLPRDLETICLKCLAKEPAKRYPTARELADDLRRFLDNHPIHARRTPLWERGAKWVRRHPTTTTLIGLSAAAVLALLVAYQHYDARNKQQARIAAQKADQQRAKSEQDLETAERFLDVKDWHKSQVILTAVITELGTDARYATLRGRARRMLDKAVRGLQDEADLSRDRERQRDFIARRNEAFRRVARYTGVDLPSDVQATRTAAQAALAVFADPGPDDRWTFARLPRTLPPDEQVRIQDDCYELLLVLADAVKEPMAGEDPVVQAGRGLKILDQAPALHPQPTPTFHRKRAACLELKGDKTGAASEYAAALGLAPTTVLDHFLAGREAFQRQDWKTALSEFEKVRQMHSDHFWAFCLRAIALLQTQQASLAKVDLNVCLDRAPGFAWLYVLRAFASGQVAVHARAAGKTLGIAKGPIEAAAEVQFEAAEDDYHKALALLGKTGSVELRWVAMVNRAIMRFQRGGLDDAVADLEQAIRLDGRQFLAHASLAQVLQRQRKWDEAIAQFTQAIALRPGWAPLHRGRAAVNQERDDQTRAHRIAGLRDLEDAIRFETPGNRVLASDHIGRAELLRPDQRFEDALAACDTALGIVPAYERAHRLRVRLLLDLHRPDDVIRSCDGALARGKPWPGLYEVRGLARASRGDYAGAIEDYSHALMLRPGQSRVLSSRGLAYVLTDSPRPALTDFDNALRLDPSNGEAHSGRGLALALQGDHRGAIAEAEESLRHDPASARRAYNAARTYAQAALAAAAEVEAKGRAAVALVERYQDRAIALLKLALERTPAERRAAFWQEQVAADPALRPLQRRLRSIQPAGAA